MTDENFTNEELQQRLEKYMDFIESSVKETGDFVIEQSPLVIQEFLNWYFYSHLFFLVIFFICALAFIPLSFYSTKKIIEDPNDINAEFTSFVSAISIFMTIMFLFLALFNFYNLIKVTVAPRLVILEKISELI